MLYIPIFWTIILGITGIGWILGMLALWDLARDSTRR